MYEIHIFYIYMTYTLYLYDCLYIYDIHSCLYIYDIHPIEIHIYFIRKHHSIYIYIYMTYIPYLYEYV